MTVFELIRRLSSYAPTAEVVVLDVADFAQIVDVDRDSEGDEDGNRIVLFTD